MTTVSALSVSSIETTPSCSAIFASPFGRRASKQLHHARQAVRDVRARDAAGVEGAHRQLRARLADRLRRHDAHGVTDLRERARRHRPPVAGLAHPAGGLALEHRAHRHAHVRGPSRGRRLNACTMSASSARPISRPWSASMRLRLVVIGLAAMRPYETVVGLAVGLVHGHFDVVLGAAVGFADDHVLRDVDEPARQVAGVGGAQGGVGEPLSRAVGRDEVLEHGQALHEVGLDRTLDDFALRVGHQAAHAGQLADLLERATRARVGHHEDRVERVEVLLHRLRDLVRGRVPLLHHGLVALLLGDQPFLVLAGDVGDLPLVLVQDRLLLRRHHDVVLGDRDARLRGVLEAEVLERVEDQRDRRRAVGLHEQVDQAGCVALLHRLVDERVLGRVVLLAQRVSQRPLDAVVVDDATDRREHVAALAPVRAELGDVVQLHHAALV